VPLPRVVSPHWIWNRENSVVNSCANTFMPFGPQPLGLVYFAGVKFVGYSAYAAFLNKEFSEKPELPPVWKSGLVRTSIGVGVGAVVGLGFWKIVPHVGWLAAHADILFWSSLFPVRVLEWYVLLWLLYRKSALGLAQTVYAISGGIFASFVLDMSGS
jgi:hypothetical protein